MNKKNKTIELLSQYFGAIWDWFDHKRGDTGYGCDVYWHRADDTCNAKTQGFSGYGDADDVLVDTINDIDDFDDDIGDTRYEFIAMAIDCYGDDAWDKFLDAVSISDE